MKPRRGIWYWLSFANLAVLFGAQRGVFGEEARDESSAMLDDLRPATPALVTIGLAAITLIAIVGLYLLLT